MKNIRQFIEDTILYEDRRLRLQMTVMTAVLFVIGFGMFLLNLSQRVTNLAVVTGLFSAVCLISFILLVIFKLQTCVSYIVSLSTVLMLLSFIYNGGVDGFSPIWICLLPSTAMFFLGMKRGIVLSAAMQIALILAFWTPLSGYLSYDYTATFLTRFPIVYFGACIMALALEYVRVLTYNKMRTTMHLLDKLGKIDELTNIENRRSFDLKLNELWDITLRGNGQISMLMIDVDCFKKYNDHYGHISGDKVLIEIADAISSAVNRRTDVVARWGGEEFTVLLPLTDTEGALQVAERIKQAVKSKKIIHEYTEIPEKYMTVSIGLAHMFPSAGTTAQDLVRFADESLYQAKSEGRNRIGQIKGLANTCP